MGNVVKKDPDSISRWACPNIAERRAVLHSGSSCWRFSYCHVGVYLHERLETAQPPVSGKMSCELNPDLRGEILSEYALHVGS